MNALAVKPSAKPQQALKPPATGGKPRLLVIDDEEAIRDLMGDIFGLRYDLTLAFDGVDGLLKFHPKTFDVVICDRLMPGKNGDQVIQEIRRMDSGQKVVMCASGAKELPQQTKESIGADAYINKPFRIDELMDAVDRLSTEKV